MAKIMISKSKSLNKSSVPEITLCLYNSSNSYAVVVYDAKFHIDAFNQGIPSLENRKVLTIEGYSTKHGSGSCDEYPEKFHFSLLDQIKIIKFGRQYLDENEAIPNNNRITQTTLEDFLILNPHQRKTYDEALKNYLNE